MMCLGLVIEEKIDGENLMNTYPYELLAPSEYLEWLKKNYPETSSEMMIKRGLNLFAQWEKDRLFFIVKRMELCFQVAELMKK